MSPHALLDKLKQRSHFVRGQRVAMDKDVAELYGISVGRLRGIVKRHLAHFPDDFMLEENNQFYFTEEGILMVSRVLRTPSPPVSALPLSESYSVSTQIKQSL
jgi:hypothetical protein